MRELFGESALKDFGPGILEDFPKGAHVQSTRPLSPQEFGKIIPDGECAQTVVRMLRDYGTVSAIIRAEREELERFMQGTESHNIPHPRGYFEGENFHAHREAEAYALVALPGVCHPISTVVTSARTAIEALRAVSPKEYACQRAKLEGVLTDPGRALAYDDFVQAVISNPVLLTTRYMREVIQNMPREKFVEQRWDTNCDMGRFFAFSAHNLVHAIGRATSPYDWRSETKRIFRGVLAAVWPPAREKFWQMRYL